MPGAVSDAGNDLSHFNFAAHCHRWRRRYEYSARQFTDLAANAVQSVLLLVIHQAPTWGKGGHLSNPQARAFQA